MTIMRCGVARRFSARVATALSLSVVWSALGAATARADDVYPYCPPKVDADCFLLNKVNGNVFTISPGQEAQVIALAHAACDYISSDTSGSNPILDYGVWFSRQPGNERVSTDSAAQFALLAAKAYCPTLLP